MKGVIFDLDGTLLDSLEDIADAANHAMTALGFRTFPVDEYRHLAGGGNRRLMTRLLRLATGGEPDEQLVARGIEHKMAYQTGPCGHAKTRPFAGVRDMLAALQAAGVQMAILSNKTEDSVREVVAQAFPDITWKHVAGAREDTPLKPDPTAALGIVKEHMLPLRAADCAFIGDTDIDMETGRAAGMTAMGVPWGFRSSEELYSSGAEIVVESASGISDFVLAGKSQLLKA